MNNSIFQVHSSKSECIGTSFVIDKDNQGVFLATCGHVVNNCNENIQVSNKDAKIIVNKYNDNLDLAILYVKGLDAEPLVLCNKSKPESVKVIGFSKFKGNPKREPINDVPIKYNIQITSPKNISIFKLYPKESISNGYSGSPVLCQRTNKVIGVVNIQVGDDTNYGISIAHLLNIHKVNYNKERRYILSSSKIYLTTEIDDSQYKIIEKEFERNLNDSLQTFSTQPIVWVDPLIKNKEEANSLLGNDGYKVDTKTIIDKPKSRLIQSRIQFGLTSLAHYLVKSAWKNNQPSLWLYIDANKLKPYKKNIEKYIHKAVANLELHFDDIECLVLDNFSSSIKDSKKIFEIVHDVIIQKHLLVMLTTSENPLTDGTIELPECRKFETLYLWSLPRNDVRKVVSKYNDKKYIGNETKVVNKLVSDLEVLNIPRTPLNCLTILKISEYEFDDSPVNRTEMIKRVLFLLFNVDDMPNYKSRPDLKDTEYILGYFCEKMLTQNKYVFTRVGFLKTLAKYCSDMEIDLEVSVIFDVLYTNNIIIQRGDEFSFRFSYWIFYFAAQRMHQNIEFSNYILEDMRYAQYPELIEFYTGIDRRRNDALTALISDLHSIRNTVENKCGLPEDFNIYEIAQWKPSDDTIQEMHNEVSDGALKSNLPDQIKDEYADNGYNRARPLNQNIHQILENYSLLKLVKGIEAASKALRNSDYCEPKIRHSLLHEVLLGWQQIINVLVVLAPVLSARGHVALEGVMFILSDDLQKESTPAGALNQVIQFFPSSVVRWYKDHLYSNKMGSLLFKHLTDDNAKLVRHELLLLIIMKRPKGWKKIIENYIISEDKNSFFLFDVFKCLRSEYKYSFASHANVRAMENLIKMSAAKHKKGSNKPGKKAIEKTSNIVLPIREVI